MKRAVDAVVVGAGPNGLAAAITIAEAGRSVHVIEAAATPGGGTRSARFTHSAAIYDVCSTVHILGVASPFFRAQPLERHGLAWAHPPIPLAHPLDGGRYAIAARDEAATLEALGADARAYRRLIGRLSRHYDDLLDDVMRPVVHRPRHPLLLSRYGMSALLPASVLVRRFETDEARALFAGCAAHAVLPLNHPLTAAFGSLFLAGAPAYGWPFARGGSQSIADAMVARLIELGGTIDYNRSVQSLAELPTARATLFDTSPGQVASIAGSALPARYVRRLQRFVHGPGVFKVDYVLSGPVPWTAEPVRRAGTVHVGGTYAEIAAAEAAVARGEHPDRPFLLAAQSTVADPSRAPAGQHVLWTYTHVPNGSTLDRTDAIERQIERFAPGFRDLVVERHSTDAAGFERYNANYVGGDIAGGAHRFNQLVARPFLSRHHYRTPNPALLLCSASTPPGAGVHGMCGYHAARAALRGALA